MLIVRESFIGSFGGIIEVRISVYFRNSLYRFFLGFFVFVLKVFKFKYLLSLLN